MFAPKVVKAQTKAIAGMALKRSTLAGHRLCHRPVERSPLLQRSERSNQHEQEAEGLARKALVASWDFSKIPVFPPDRPNRSQPSPFATPSLPGAIHPKLAIGRVDDPLEHEADRIADQVMRMPVPEASVTAASPQLSRKCAACEEEDAQALQTKRAGPPEAAGSGTPGVVLEMLRSPGQSLDTPTRAFFEPRFEHDFSRVRVHADGAAGKAARAVRARAYTIGSHVVFGSGEYAPATVEGKRLLAHELVHVLQQASSEDAWARGTPAKQRGNQMDKEEELRVHSTPRAVRSNSALLLQRKAATIPKSPGDCTLIEHRTLQDEVDKWCHGQKACAQTDECPILLDKIGKFANCALARAAINVKCFRGGNEGHIVALASAVGAVRNCLAEYNRKKCKPDQKEEKPVYDNDFLEKMSALTGLTGAALIAYIIISEGSRVIPVRNLIPVP